MNPTHLIRMANQIGAFFETMPDAEQGAAGVAEHIGKFWEPRMQATLAAYLAEYGDQALKPIVRNALRTMPIGAARAEKT
jgi:formate dehydrogenase subunit delta